MRYLDPRIVVLDSIKTSFGRALTSGVATLLSIAVDGLGNTTARFLSLGIAGNLGGFLQMNGVTSGSANIIAQAAAGSPTLTLPTSTGTFVVAASAPLVVDVQTGNLTLSTAADAPVTETGATHTVATTTKHLICNQAGTTTVTLPAAGSFLGREICIKTIQAQTVVSNASNVVPSTSATAGTAILPATDGAWARLISDGSNWIIMEANPLV